MKNEFFELDSGWGRQFYFGAMLSDIPAEWDDGMRGFTDTVDIGIIKGSRPGDIIRTDLPGILIVSEKLLDVFRENSFRNYGTYSVRITHNDEEIKGYHGLVFYGKGGHFLPEFSDIVYGPPDRNGKPQIYESKCLAIDITEWDGSDLFYIPDFPIMHIITENVADAFKRAKVTNCDLTLECIIGVDPKKPD